MNKNDSVPEQPSDLDTLTLAAFVMFAIASAIFLAAGGIFILAEGGGTWILLGLLLLAVVGFIVNYIRSYVRELGRRFE